MTGSVRTSYSIPFLSSFSFLSGHHILLWCCSVQRPPYVCCVTFPLLLKHLFPSTQHRMHWNLIPHHLFLAAHTHWPTDKNTAVTMHKISGCVTIHLWRQLSHLLGYPVSPQRTCHVPSSVCRNNRVLLRTCDPDVCSQLAVAEWHCFPYGCFITFTFVCSCCFTMVLLFQLPLSHFFLFDALVCFHPHPTPCFL